MKVLSSPSALHKLAVEYYFDLYTVDESDQQYRVEMFQQISEQTNVQHKYLDPLQKVLYFGLDVLKNICKT